MKHAYGSLRFVRDAMAVGSGNMQALDKDVEDVTVQNDVDSGLQMAISPCSALSASSATFARSATAQHKNEVAATGTGTFGHSGIKQCHYSHMNKPDQHCSAHARASVSPA